jgi:hypothetical protein
MIGISSESFNWRTHILFAILRARVKVSLRKYGVIENKYLDKGRDFEIQGDKIEFRMETINKSGSHFINSLIRNMIIEWYFNIFP